jgi:hypothetical protein
MAEVYANANGSFDTTIAFVPEPSSFPLFGGGLLLLSAGALRWRRWARFRCARPVPL